MNHLCLRSRVFGRVIWRLGVLLLCSGAELAQAVPSVTFQLSNHTNAPGDTVTARVTVGAFTQVTSAQFTLQWDPIVLQYVGTGGYGLGGLGAGNFGTTLTNSGRLTFSWDDPNGSGVTVADDTVIFTVSYVVAGSAGSSSPLRLVDQPTAREVVVDFSVAIFNSVDGQVQVVTPSSAPVITSEPADLTVNVGASATFTVGVTGTPSPNYFWRRNGVPIAGATASNYTTNNVQLADSGSQFSCLVSNLAGTAPSQTAILTVVPTNWYSVHKTNVITINDYSPATPYPSAAEVSNVAGKVRKATVTLHGLSHTWPDDIGVLLVGPQGQKIELMADAGASQPIAGQTITFDDDAATGLLADDPIVSGTYKPGPCGSGDTFAPPAPAAPYATALSAVTGANPNGTWSLYVQDDALGDIGSIAGGWTLMLSLDPSPPAPVFVPGTLKHLTNGQFQFKLAGAAGSNYEIQVSSDLRNWKGLKTLLMTNSSSDFLDVNTNVLRRFYRARLLP